MFIIIFTATLLLRPACARAESMECVECEVLMGSALRLLWRRYIRRGRQPGASFSTRGKRHTPFRAAPDTLPTSGELV